MDRSILLEKTTRELSGLKDFSELASKGVKLVVDAMEGQGVVASCIFKIHQDKNELWAYAYSAKKYKLVENLIKTKFSDLKVSLDKIDNLTVRTVVRNKIEQSNKLKDFSAGTIPDKVVDLVQQTIQANLIIAFPIHHKSGKVIGAVMFALQQTHLEPEQFSMLESFANQLGLAYSNVFAYERLMDTYKRDLSKLGTASDQSDIPSIKFTLRITQKENAKLESLVNKSEKKKTKAEIIRELIDGA